MSNPENFGPRCEDYDNIYPTTKEYIDVVPIRENSASLSDYCSSKNMGTKSGTIPQPLNGYETLKNFNTNSCISTSRKVTRCKKKQETKKKKKKIIQFSEQMECFATS